MKVLTILLWLLVFGCGKDPQDHTTHNKPETPQYEVKPSDRERVRYRISCFLMRDDQSLTLSFKIHGNYLRGMFHQCLPSLACAPMGHYVTYVNGNVFCFTKRGFEDQLTLCSPNPPEMARTQRGELLRIEKIQDQSMSYIYCDQTLKKMIAL